MQMMKSMKPKWHGSLVLCLRWHTLSQCSTLSQVWNRGENEFHEFAIQCCALWAMDWKLLPIALHSSMNGKGLNRWPCRVDLVATVVRCRKVLPSFSEWEFQDAKMAVLYHISPYFVDFCGDIPLYRPYIVHSP